MTVTPYLKYKVKDNCILDSDNDGISDSNDSCPDTPEGAAVDFNGCELFTLPIVNNKVSVTSLTCIATRMVLSGLC